MIFKCSDNYKPIIQSCFRVNLKFLRTNDVQIIDKGYPSDDSCVQNCIDYGSGCKAIEIKEGRCRLIVGNNPRIDPRIDPRFDIKVLFIICLES